MTKFDSTDKYDNFRVGSHRKKKIYFKYESFKISIVGNNSTGSVRLLGARSSDLMFDET